MAQENNTQKGHIEVSLNRNPANSTFCEHTHPFNEIYFLLSGKVNYFIKDELFTANSGDVIMVKRHYIHTTSYPAGTASERILILYDDAFLGGEYKELTNYNAQKKLFSLSHERQSEIEKVVRKLYLEYKNKEENYLNMCKNLLGQLLILLKREDKPDTEKELSGTPLVIQNAAKYITANFGDDLTLQSLSQMFAMSPSYFSKSFKQFTGLGVNEYITAVRLANAKKLLKTSTLSITEISLKCGFNDSNYFATVFKKMNGVSPKRYSKEQ